MVSLKKIKSDFGFYESLDHSVAVAAAHTVCRFATDPNEAALLLDILGLIDPLPGNEPANPKKSAQWNREKRERIEAEALERLGVTPDEIGEEPS